MWGVVVERLNYWATKLLLYIASAALRRGIENDTDDGKRKDA